MKVLLKDLVALQNLDKDSLVVDVGGYLGDYAQEVINRFNCRVILYEPNPEAFNECMARFINNSNVMLVNNAIGNKTSNEKLYLDKESSSFFKNWVKTDKYVIVRQLQASQILKNLKIDALKLNCEGTEYEIIEDLDQHDMLKDFKEILVQFHKTGGNVEKIRKVLAKTHKKIYSLKWDLWIRNP